MTWSMLNNLAMFYLAGVLATMCAALVGMGVGVFARNLPKPTAERVGRNSARLFLSSWAWPAVSLAAVVVAICKVTERLIKKADFAALWKGPDHEH
ncbi:hypothetical protein [Glutamicibacter sp.]|uniref:hypothetical protein n=1 Tax=Glutamicibacter sp. TaxID=1931995 RepID=UPI0028BDFAF6|nr:hypothetical protein [Glutamicibacter sp.]